MSLKRSQYATSHASPHTESHDLKGQTKCSWDARSVRNPTQGGRSRTRKSPSRRRSDQVNVCSSRLSEISQPSCHVCAYFPTPSQVGPTCPKWALGELFFGRIISVQQARAAL